MKPFAADFYLTLQARKVVLGEGKVLLIFTQHNQPFDGLRQQKLMMEGNIRSSVLQRKDNPYSQETNQLRGKK